MVIHEPTGRIVRQGDTIRSKWGDAWTFQRITSEVPGCERVLVSYGRNGPESEAEPGAFQLRVVLPGNSDGM